ncbi:MAG: sensor histidine kinase [Burkholderiales bacterium]|jgi:sensor histidine kinase YesM
MHPILADGRRLFAYLVAWGLVGTLISTQLWLAGPFDWAEAFAFGLPLTLVFGFAGLGAFWVCQAAPLQLSRMVRSLVTQLIAAMVSAALWLGAARGWAMLLERTTLFPDILAKQALVWPLMIGLGVALFLLTAALNYLLMALGASQAAERRALQFEISSREAELRALRAQIHPHFLFNSLNSINALIAARPEEARRLCVGLADFLRHSLTFGSREAITLAEELALAERLLSIEKVRFGERLSHVIEADDEARSCVVPPLLLQPLVENAVTHGIAERLEGGQIRIEAARDGAFLRIAITNPRDADAPRRPGTGIGLQNVRRRLAALHGDEAELRTVPSDDSFRVELRLPAKH